MPGGNFADRMTIVNGGLKPHGPLDLAEGEVVERIDIWVFQDAAACSGFLKEGDEGLNLTLNKWEMNPQYLKDNNFGDDFRPGAAIGMGMLVKRKGKGATAIVEQWNKAIILE
jgi:hypothetical protein